MPDHLSKLMFFYIEKETKQAKTDIEKCVLLNVLTAGW